MTLNVAFLLVPDSSISLTADPVGFSHTCIPKVYREWFDKRKISSEQQFSGQNCLVDARGQTCRRSAVSVIFSGVPVIVKSSINNDCSRVAY